MYVSDGSFAGRGKWVGLVLLTCCVIPADNTAKAADSATVEQVLAVWKERSEGLKSFRYVSTLQEIIVPARRSDSGDPFGRTRDVVTPYSVITFSMQSDKIAYREEREQWDESSNAFRKIRIAAIFDGDYNRRVIEGGSVTHGQVERAKRPADILTVHANQTAVWLLKDATAWLDRVGYRPGQMQIVDRCAFIDEEQALALAFPRNNRSWRALIHATRGAEFLPQRYIEEYNGAVRRDLTIQYLADREYGWAVSGWNDKWFNEAGVNYKTVNASVTEHSISQPIDNREFTLDFPKGTHVVNRSGTPKYFIAIGNGQRRAISLAEYGKIPAANSGR